MSLPTPTLRTERLILRPFEARDKADLVSLHSDPIVARYWDEPAWDDPSRAERFLAQAERMEAESLGARVAVERADDSAFLGWCGIARWNREFRSAAIGYAFAESTWGRGYATEAARALLDWAFPTLDLNRIQAEADTRNIACRRVLEKLGFTLEGTLREDCIVDGVVSDSWIFGLLARDRAAS